MSTVTTKQNKSDTVFTKQYSYYHGSESNATTNMVGSISYKSNSGDVIQYDYTYNDNGNIQYVYEYGEKVAVYTYDSLNQLVWYADTRTGRYIRIVYDNYGNIQKMESYSLGTNWAPVKLLETRTYSYGDTNWKDKLTEFDGDSITYDKNGNPLTYRDNMAFEWENGRILKNINTSDKAIQMSYDSNGMRTQKSIDGVKTNYYYDSSNNLFALTQGSDTLFFYYDNSGEVMSVSCNGTMYYYIKDLQGDITEIVDKDGKAVAEYAYDAWGNMLTEDNGKLTVGKLNPFRYRSYVYDEETGLYYLQSRYYDPVTGRFLNADVYTDTESGTPLSTNMFAYCENNAITKVDTDGKDAWWLQDSMSVWTMGHTSLLIQETHRRWWYLYWGDKSIKLIYIGTCTLRSLNYYLRTHYQTYKDKHNKYVNEQLYEGSYNKIIHFKGNFYNSLKYIYYTLMGQSGSIKTIGIYYYYGNPSYDVFERNCMQMSVKALLKGYFKYYDWYYKSALNIAKNVVIPNVAYRGLKTFNMTATTIYNVKSALNRLKDFARYY